MKKLIDREGIEARLEELHKKAVENCLAVQDFHPHQWLEEKEAKEYIKLDKKLTRYYAGL